MARKINTKEPKQPKTAAFAADSNLAGKTIAFLGDSTE